MRDAYLRRSIRIWLWLEPPTVKDRRRLAVASALGSTRAEGLTVGAATVCDLADYAEGKLTAAQLRALVLARHRKET